MSPDRSKGSDQRKTLQLCAQVRRTLSHYLNLEATDETLQSLYVEDVEPAPDANRLQVTLCAPPELQIEKLELLALLEGIKPTLRNEIARAIHRRKTPDLTFLLVREPS